MTPDETKFFKRSFGLTRSVANRRRIAWNITEAEWLGFWETCALRIEKFENGPDVAICRIDEAKPWDIDNVQALMKDDYWIMKKASTRKGVGRGNWNRTCPRTVNGIRTLTTAQWVEELKSA